MKLPGNIVDLVIINLSLYFVCK